jgi:D-tyrosyl-tRNA(Tyr) deacylase
MRAVVQRVARASVSIDGEIVGAIGPGLCVLVGAMTGDGTSDAEFIARKLAGLRIFHDEHGKMNRSVLDVGGELLVISQFTLAADTTSGTRPSFTSALPPAEAERLLAELIDLLRERGITVACGRFGAVMSVELVNQGPVTIILDSQAKKRK